MYTINDFAMMEPMRYYNNEKDCPKRQDMINNKNNEYIGTVKKDGDWSMLIHYEKGRNLIRSRSISKVTGVYGDYTDKVPHICAAMDELPDNTVLLAELCWDRVGTNANTVGTILRCLPAKAVERQAVNKLHAVVFDALMIDGVDMVKTPYTERLSQAAELLKHTSSPYLYLTQIVILTTEMPTFIEYADLIIQGGGEGLVIQRKDNPYMPGARTAWKTLKLKQTMPEMELQVIGALAPNKIYEGDLVESWPYWEDGKPVTKPYYFSWKNGITVKYNDTTCDVASGLTDADREWLATDAAAAMIANGELYAVVRAMSENDKGRLRHPYVVRLRNDM